MDLSHETADSLRTHRARILDPEARERTGDWEQVACETVAMLRLEAGRCPGDRRLGELTLNSPEFSTWWNDHRVLRHTHGSAHYWHRLVGDLHFSYEFMQLPGDDNQTLCVYLPEPHSATAESLGILSSWNASTTGTAPDPRPTGPGS
ncbi:MmyB family transcriptional regulator [Streptomyces sp. 900105755]